MKIAKGHDALKAEIGDLRQQIAALQSQPAGERLPGMRGDIRMVSLWAMPSQQQATEFKRRLLALLDEYGVEEMSVTYKR